MVNILIGCTGSVATLKLPNLARALVERNAEAGDKNIDVRVVVTEHAKHFFCEHDLPRGIQVFTDADEWAAWSQRGDPVLHVELTKWADVFLIAPLDANTLAKIANGICDNLLTCTARAWNIQKPLYFCPAMNTHMYNHPITKTHISVLQAWGYQCIPVVEKTLICGDTGLGAMAEVSTILEYIEKYV